MATRAKRRSAKPKRLTKKDLNAMYRNMLRIRRFEEKTDEFFMAGHVKGAVHVSIGQEACSVGVCTALNNEDAILTTHRGHGHSIAKGTRMPEMMAELLGKSTGLCKARGGSMHIADISKGHYGAHSIVGANMPMATGMGLAYQLEGTGRVAVVFFGDGASNQGSFHESMNLCAIWKLPVIFFCENNHYAVSYHVERSTSVKDISVRAQGYNAPGVTVDGMDVVAVYEATAEARAQGARWRRPQFDRGEDLPLLRPLARRPAVRPLPHERRGGRVEKARSADARGGNAQTHGSAEKGALKSRGR